MAYRLEPSASTQDEVRRVANERLSKAIVLLDGLSGSGPNEIEDAVHEVRKRCKETRGLARLVRPALGDQFGRLNHTVRDAANELSSIRDAHALLGTFDDLRETTGREDDPLLDQVRSRQAASADAATRAINAGDRRIKDARRLLVDARCQVANWDLPDGFAPLGDGLARTYRRGRRAMKHAQRRPTDERMHEWRKAVKNLWYQVRLLRGAAPGLLRPLGHRLDDLAEALGDDHDLAVLIQRLELDPGRFGGEPAAGEAVRLARAAQEDLRVRAFRLGATIYAEPTSAFVARCEAYWTTTVELGPEPATARRRLAPPGLHTTRPGPDAGLPPGAQWSRTGPPRTDGRDAPGMARSGREPDGAGAASRPDRTQHPDAAGRSARRHRRRAGPRSATHQADRPPRGQAPRFRPEAAQGGQEGHPSGSQEAKSAPSRCPATGRHDLRRADRVVRRPHRGLLGPGRRARSRTRHRGSVPTRRLRFEVVNSGERLSRPSSRVR